MDSIVDTEEYRDFEGRHNRHINMLSDNVSHPFSCTRQVLTTHAAGSKLEEASVE